jgi:hypothetical protein
MTDLLNVTPSQLHAEITQTIAEVSGCHACWEEHSKALTADELRNLREEVNDLITKHIVEAYLVEAGGKES